MKVVNITTPKNRKKYEEKYQSISSDDYTRLMEYLDNNPITEKEYHKLKERIKEIKQIKYNYMKIVFDIIPEPTPRPKLSQGRFYVKNSKKNSEFVRLVVKKDIELVNFITTPCIYTVKNYFPIPQDFNKIDTILAELGLNDMITLPDWDNLGKTYSDMVQTWIISNDSLIIDGRSMKYYSLKPRVEILIKYKEKHTCKRNERIIKNSISVQNGLSQRNDLIH